MDFWRHASLPGTPVDIHVTEEGYVKVSRQLKQEGMEFMIAIADVDAAVKREKMSHSRASSGFWYSRYHPLHEVQVTNGTNRVSTVSHCVCVCVCVCV